MIACVPAVSLHLRHKVAPTNRCRKPRPIKERRLTARFICSSISPSLQIEQDNSVCAVIFVFMEDENVEIDINLNKIPYFLNLCLTCNFQVLVSLPSWLRFHLHLIIAWTKKMYLKYPNDILYISFYADVGNHYLTQSPKLCAKYVRSSAPWTWDLRFSCTEGTSTCLQARYSTHAQVQPT